METGQAVVNALLRRKNAVRVALTDSPWTDSILQWVSQGYPTRTVRKEVGQNGGGRMTASERRSRWPANTWSPCRHGSISATTW